MKDGFFYLYSSECELLFCLVVYGIKIKAQSSEYVQKKNWFSYIVHKKMRHKIRCWNIHLQQYSILWGLFKIVSFYFHFCSFLHPDLFVVYICSVFLFLLSIWAILNTLMVPIWLWFFRHTTHTHRKKKRNNFVIVVISFNSIS